MYSNMHLEAGNLSIQCAKKYNYRFCFFKSHKIKASLLDSSVETPHDGV